MGTRFYFPSTGAAAVSPAVAGYWSVTTGFDRLAMSTTPANTANGTKGTNETVSGNVHALVRQYVGPNNLAAGTVAGTFQLAIRAEESNADANMFLDCVIKVVSSDGSTVRGTLYAGQGTYTASASTTSPQYEFDQTPTRRSRILSGTLTPVTAQAGDRLVVELGYSDNNSNTTGRTGTLHFGDETIDTDLAYAVDLGDTSNRPWIEFAFGVDATVTVPPMTGTADAPAPSLSESQTILPPPMTAAVGAPIPTPDAIPTYTATITLGDHSWVIESGACDFDNPIQVLDSLRIGWQLPESSPWPTQPEAVTCQLGLWTQDVAELEDVAIGTPLSVVLSDLLSHEIATFHGRVASQSARPRKDGPGQLSMFYSLSAVDYTVDLAETPVTVAAEWPAETAAVRMERVFNACTAAGAIMGDPPTDYGDAAFEAYAPTTTTAADLLEFHLSQIAIDNGDGPQRYIVVPLVVGGTLVEFSAVLLDVKVDAAILPGTLDVVDGLLTIVFPDLDADGVVDACDVDLDTTWNRLKFRATNVVTVTGDTVTATAGHGGTPVRLNLDTTLTVQAAADRMAELYLPDVDETNGWVADVFTFYAHRQPAALWPAWFPDHRTDPVSTALYVMPIAIVGIPANVNLSGETSYAGQLSKVSLTLEKKRARVEFALRRQLPASDGADAVTWDWITANYPGITWDDVDPAVSWYDLRLVRIP